MQVMKQSFIFIMAFFMLISCSSLNQIVEINNSTHALHRMKLSQNLDSNSSRKSGNILVNQFFKTKINFIFEEKSKLNPNVSVDFQMSVPFSTGQLDSVMILNLDNEKIRIVSSKNDSLQVAIRRFTVPVNLWTSIANSQDIQFRLYVGKEEIEIKPDLSETGKLKEFFNRALHNYEESVPAVPEGQKKW